MSKKHQKSIVALSALLIDLAEGVPTEVKLVPAGSFRSARDNRPVGIPAWNMTTAAAGAIIGHFSQLSSDFLIDYDHQTLNAKVSGEKSPAAGWGGSLEWREGDGLYATNIAWNAAALTAIEAKEYRYISPVIQFDEKTGDVMGVPMAALTNYPALDNLTDLAAAAADIFSTPQDMTMDLDNLLQQLIYMLNLPVTVTPAEIGVELDKIKTLITNANGTTEGLSALLTAKATAALSAVPDPALYVPITVVNEMRAREAALSGITLESTVDKLIEDGVKAGKILGNAEKLWAKTMGLSNISALQGYLDAAQGIAALSGLQTNGIPPEAITGIAALSADESAVAEQLGLTQEQMIAQRGKK
jgi:phage I-like protein